MHHPRRKRSSSCVRACIFAACLAVSTRIQAQTAQSRVSTPPCDAGSPPDADGRCPDSGRRLVVLFAGHPTLERAMRRALVPWHMRVAVIDRKSPGSSMPRSSVRARALVAELGADALVWISTGPEGTALWVEDAQSSNLITRAIADPPFNEPLAAALALSVKTILASSGWAPPEPAESETDDQAAGEVGTTQSSAEPADASPEPARVQTAAPDRPAPAVARASEAAPPTPAAPAPAPTPTAPAAAQFVVFGAARFNAFRPAETGARYGIELRWFPVARAEGWERLVWCAASVETSTPWTLSRTTFRGQYWEFTPGLALGMGGSAASGLHLGGSFQFALHWVSISGTRLDDGGKVEKSRYSPALAVRPEVGWRFGATTLLLQPALGYFALRQLYEQSGTSVLRTRPIWWMIGGALALEWR
ncbi:MAG: hypothetical protein ABI895_23050 [Deltaproteobacteria bacterium]